MVAVEGPLLPLLLLVPPPPSAAGAGEVVGSRGAKAGEVGGLPLPLLGGEVGEVESAAAAAAGWQVSWMSLGSTCIASASPAFMLEVRSEAQLPEAAWGCGCVCGGGGLVGDPGSWG